MKKIRLLIVEPSNWAHKYGGWLSQRGYAVDIYASWGLSVRNLEQENYDLALIDETFTLSNKSNLRGLREVGKDIAVISSHYSVEGYRKAIQGGAKGYIRKELDQDTFVRELEKILRSMGKLPRHGRILIVDNDDNVLKALSHSLGREGYEVFIAKSAEEAKRNIPLFQPHVAIVDIRLRDDNDPLDQSGFDLIREVYGEYGHAMRLIGVTGSPGRSAASKASGLVSGFILKDHGTRNIDNDELVQKIEGAREELGINLSVEVEFRKPLSLLGLVDMIKAYRDLDDTERKRISIELEELIRKLFRTELEVRGTYMHPGRGGSGVVLMRPVVEGTKGQHFVIKFGPRENITTELKKYNLFVKPFVGKHATQLIDIADKPVETLNLAGLKFSFAGMSVDEPRDFNAFYRDTKVTNDQLCASLDYLFHETCKSWYQAKRDWSDRTANALAIAYESQLSLDREKLAEVNDTFSRLSHGTQLHGLSFEYEDQKHVRVKFGEVSFLFPSPLSFLENNRDKFPVPRFECRTHGDLNSRNIFVDEDNKIWLIDFFKTGWGPILRDYAELECAIKFELIDTNNLGALYEFEKALLTPDHFGKPIEFANKFHVGELDRAQSAIAKLRKLAQDDLESLDIREYYIGIFYYAIKMMTWEGVSSAEIDRYPIRQRHALMSAAMIAYRLENWGDNWQGWPDERPVTHLR